MKKTLITIACSALALASCNEPRKDPLPTVVAHRGCWLMDGDEYYINENCPAGVRMAARYGYPAVEIDVKYTLDSVMVIMHDGTINRTMRNATDYSKIKQPVTVTGTTFDELRTGYVLESADPALRTPIPTLEEELLVCKEYGIVAMLHSEIPESYVLAEKILGSDGWIAFHSNEDAVRKAREISGCLVLLDPGRVPAENTVERLTNLGGKAGMSTMKYDMLDSDYIATVRNAGFEVQASIFPTPEEVRAVRDGVSIQLSDFCWFPTPGTGKKAERWRISKSLSDGQELTWTSEEDAGDFLAYTLDLTFTGSVEVELNGRSYSLTREEPGTEHFGLRLYKKTPSIRIRAVGPAEVRAEAAVYAL